MQKLLTICCVVVSFALLNGCKTPNFGTAQLAVATSDADVGREVVFGKGKFNHATISRVVEGTSQYSDGTVIAEKYGEQIRAFSKINADVAFIDKDNGKIFDAITTLSYGAKAQTAESEER